MFLIPSDFLLTKGFRQNMAKFKSICRVRLGLLIICGERSFDAGDQHMKFVKHPLDCLSQDRVRYYDHRCGGNGPMDHTNPWDSRHGVHGLPSLLQCTVTQGHERRVRRSVRSAPFVSDRDRGPGAERPKILQFYFSLAWPVLCLIEVPTTTDGLFCVI